MMGKQPYIPLYIGDWEQDTNCLGVLQEFCLLKLTFKLFSSQERGVFCANIRTLSILFKSTIDESRCALADLKENNILNIEEIEPDKFLIKSRRMIREANISETRANSASKKQTKPEQNPKQNSQKQKTKPEQNHEYDIEYIVKLLNAKSKKDFSIKTTKTIDLIKTRVNEGFTKEDFERVIIFKCEEWNDDPKMVKFIRPETLFGNKFEGYLQSVPKTNPTSTVDPDKEIERLLPTYRKPIPINHDSRFNTEG